ncbi:MAG TPA: hypothetical protein VMC62_09665 [Longilinea sp.]|nr:hypothetical protein [Longilinea sp.]
MMVESANETRYDLGVAWEWEYDAPFIALLEAACRLHALNFLQITPQNLAIHWPRLDHERIKIHVFLDRASDANDQFLPLSHWAETHAYEILNPTQAASLACDKATLHRLVTHAGLKTPYTCILPPYEISPEPQTVDLRSLGANFIVKPAHGGGSLGVMVNACTADDIQHARQTYPADAYLLQTTVMPAEIEKQPAWFRVLYCCGSIFPCWWHPQTHIYTPVSPEDVKYHRLQALHTITAALASICRLDLFSTEIALTSDRSFVVIDYVNDPVDLRLKSLAADGVPDEIVRQIVEALARHAGSRTENTFENQLPAPYFE